MASVASTTPRSASRRSRRSSACTPCPWSGWSSPGLRGYGCCPWRLGQCLLLVVYSELAAEYPLANGIYQWSRRLLGPSYGWFTGWVVLGAYAVANTTIAYLGAPWAPWPSSGSAPSPAAIVVAGAVIVLACSLINACGVDVLRRAINAGVSPPSSSPRSASA